MEFDLSEEQVMLRDTVRDVLTSTYDVETLRSVTDTDLGWSRDVWNSLAEIGILGLVFSEDDGGMGAGPEELSVVMGELGASLAPEPLLGSVIVPGMLVARTADDATRADVIGGLSSGERLLAFAHTEPGDRWPHTAVTTTAVDGNLTGTKTLVDHGDVADTFVVSARESDGTIGLYLVAADADGLARTAYRTHDRRRGAQIELTGAAGTRLGSGDASQVISDVEVATQSALCAEAVGAMTRALQLTVEYLKTRKQFGVPLATFQALTHRAADMYVSNELAQSMSTYFTAALADGDYDPIIASRAKLQICRSGRHVGQEAIQMHGGIGMTAEYPVGHYVSRLTAISHTLGDADSHLARLSGSVSEWDMVTVG
ncbi:Acyl-CoA dehydrogenase [Gordonia malaquae]|uniref:Putative acyl-CoA dehydrogenase n=1 Tax=Gordonia malaquae NBRC 108250 TaxID=1223542 RepID=M3ULD6_GORML|nr:acyl-CoA dehydrogenase family protein [Gordonia malaquae]GAC80525.1 putative acyl-CoA dehydrogenase [Gordonia malaquae NBRC 108250]SEE17838.1 Acyl-CoA dehydrogenase [Gordonia malaquae]